MISPTLLRAECIIQTSPVGANVRKTQQRSTLSTATNGGEKRD